MNLVIFSILALYLGTVLTAENFLQCQNIARCVCRKTDQHLEYNCQDNVGNSVNIEINSLAKIVFSCTLLNKSYTAWISLLDGMKFGGSFEMIFINRCSLPEKSFKHLLQFLDIEKVRKLQLEYILNGDTVFENHYFDSLDFLDELSLQNNEISQLPDAVFYNLTNLKSLYISTNKLANITRKLFQPTPKLELLELGRNNLTTLPAGAFSNLKNLTLLNLYSNKLTNLKREVFSGISKLKYLDLNSNGITTLNDDVFYELTYLQDLNLCKNKILFLPDGIFANNNLLKRIRARESYNSNLTTLALGSFANLMSLQNLQLNLNNFTHLPEDLFLNAYNLTTVDLSQNNLTSMPGMIFEFTTNLKELNLGFNALTSLNDTLFRKLTKLVTLHLEHNKLNFINGKVFSSLTSLKKLYLHHNNLMSLGYGVFSNLKELIVINLSGNHLDMGENFINNDWVSHLHYCLNLEEIYLKNNSVPMIYTDWIFSLLKLKKLDLSYNAIHKLATYDLQFFATPLSVNLSNNNITSINLSDLETIAGSNSDTSQRSRNVEVSLHNNSIVCDCEVYDLARYFQDRMNDPGHDYVKLKPNNINCQYPNDSKQIQLSNLNLFDIYCYNVRVCPSGCTCAFRPVDKAVAVECNSTSLKQLPRDALQNFRNVELFLANKSLTSLKEVSSLISHSNVTRLILSHNNLKNVKDLSLPQSLKILELHDNELTHLNEDTIEKLNRSSNLKSITLRNNPWQCSCETKYLLNFLQTKHSLVSDLNNITCKEDGKPIIKLSIDDLCKFSLTMIIVCVSLATFGIVFGTLTALYYRYQHEIKVWLFAHKLCLWLVAEKELDRNKIYDAFISYSHLDEEFVVKHLVQQLENEDNFKLCLHFRDWIVGDWIPDQIIRSVEDSRRTVVVLSPNFLNSVWGKIEFRTAHLKAIKERCARVIIILLKDIGPTDKLDPELRAYLTMNTYLKWGDPWFWQKLKYALPHPQQYCKQHPLSITKELMNVNGNVRVNKLNVAPCLELLVTDKKKKKKKNKSILNF